MTIPELSDKWQPYPEHKPTLHQVVWVWDSGYGLAKLTENGWVSISDEYQPFNVTYWQEIPVPPPPPGTYNTD